MTENKAWLIGDSVAINEDGKVMLSDKCPCGALIWDISVTAGQTYSFNINYSSIEAQRMAAMVYWGDEEIGEPPERVEYAAAGPTHRAVYHTYTNGGEYRIKVTGQVEYFGHSEAYRSFPIRAVSFDLSTYIGSFGLAYNELWGFYNCPNMQEIATGCTFGKRFRDGTSMFEACIGLESIYDLIFPETITGAFVSGSLVRPGYFNMDRMFFGCSSLVTVVSLVFPRYTGTFSASYMFSGCTNLTAIGSYPSDSRIEFPKYVGTLLEHTYSVFSAYNMFFGSGLQYVPELVFPLEIGTGPSITSAGFSTGYMFGSCTSLSDVSLFTIFDLSALKVGDNFFYVYTNDMFSGDSSLTTGIEVIFPEDLPSGRINCSYMFSQCAIVEAPPIRFPRTLGSSEFATDGSLDCRSMYANSSSLKKVNSITFPEEMGTGDNVTTAHCLCSGMFPSGDIVGWGIADWNMEALVFPRLVGTGPSVTSAYFRSDSMVRILANIEVNVYFPDEVPKGEFNTNHMFDGSEITSVGTLVFPSIVGGNFSVVYMFGRCPNLKTVPNLLFPDYIGKQFTILSMFRSSGLEQIPGVTFPIQVGGLSANSIFSVFSDCSSAIWVHGDEWVWREVGRVYTMSSIFYSRSIASETYFRNNPPCSLITNSTERATCARNQYYHCSNWLPNGTYPATWTTGATTGDDAYGCSNIHQAPWFNNIYWSC